MHCHPFLLPKVYLIRWLNDLGTIPDFIFHQRCEIANYASYFSDDLLHFSRANIVPLKIAFSSFSNYGSACGLEGNLDNSDIYFCGIFEELHQTLMHEIGILKGILVFQILRVTNYL